MLLNETLLREMIDPVVLQAAIDELTASLYTAAANGQKSAAYSNPAVLGTDPTDNAMVNLIRAYFEEQGLRTEIYKPGEQCCNTQAPVDALTISATFNFTWWMKNRY